MIKFPKTINGWKTLYWLSIKRCPYCHSLLSQSFIWHNKGYTLYKDKISLWCIKCNGIRYPKGFFRTLRENYLIYKEKNNDKNNDI